MKKTSSIIIVVIFFSLLVVPHIADKIVKSDRSVANENRNLTKLPEEFDYEKIASQLEECYNDRIPFRSNLLKCSQKLQSKLFAFSLGNSLKGKNDFYFYQPGNWENTVEHFCGKWALRYNELEERRKFMVKLHKFLKKEKKEFLFVIAPNKIQIYPEYLPERRNHPESEKSPDRQFIKYMQQHNPEIPLMELRSPLLAAKKFYGDALFYRADTHWSPVGGYIGAAAIIKHFSPDTAKLPAPGDFKIKPNGLKEPDDMRNQILNNSTTVDYPEMVPDVAVFKGKLVGDGKPFLVSINPNAKDKRKVLMYRDSFTVNMQPWISNHFREVHYVRMHRVSRQLIRKIDPDIVIVEYVARLTRKMKTKLR